MNFKIVKVKNSKYELNFTANWIRQARKKYMISLHYELYSGRIW